MDSRKQISDSVALGLWMSASGGLMDAYSYLCRGEVFIHAQTGNVLLFGINLARGDLAAAGRFFLPMMAFMLGVAAAELIHHRLKNSGRIHWRQLIVLLEAALLASVAFIPGNAAANAVACFGFGLQVQCFRSVAGFPAATVMLIGNMRSAITAVCSYAEGENPKGLRHAALYFGIVLCFAGGAVAGDWLVECLGQKAIFASCGMLLVAYAAMTLEKRRNNQH